MAYQEHVDQALCCVSRPAMQEATDVDVKPRRQICLRDGDSAIIIPVIPEIQQQFALSQNILWDVKLRTILPGYVKRLLATGKRDACGRRRPARMRAIDMNRDSWPCCCHSVKASLNELQEQA